MHLDEFKFRQDKCSREFEFNAYNDFSSQIQKLTECYLYHVTAGCSRHQESYTSLC
jgi:hypothetical protein